MRRRIITNDYLEKIFLKNFDIARRIPSGNFRNLMIVLYRAGKSENRFLAGLEV